MPATSETNRGRPARALATDRVVLATGIVIVLAGAGLALLRFVNSQPPERQDLEATIGTIMLGVAVATPGFLTLMARYDRPPLLLPASIMLVPFSFLSFALVTLPLLIPAVMLSIAYQRHRRSGEGWWDAVLSTALIVGAVASVVTLFAGETRRTYSTPTSTHFTEIIGYPNSALSLTLVLAVLALGWFGAARPDA